VKVILRAKMPPSQGVSSGPTIVASHTKRLSVEMGEADTPSGGADVICFRSLSSRSCAGEVIRRRREKKRAEEEEEEEEEKRRREKKRMMLMTTNEKKK
jgi:hypothetical protein